MIIDCHVHVVHDAVRQPGYRLPKGEEPVRDTLFAAASIQRELSLAHADAVLQSMDSCGIGMALIFGLPWCTMAMCRANNEYVRECHERHPNRFVPFGVIQPRETKEALEELDRILGHFRFKGVKVKPFWQGFRLDDEEIMGPILEKIVSYDAAIVVHIDQMIRPDKYDMPYRLLKIKQKYPAARIIAAHLGGLLCLYALYEPLREPIGDIWYDTALPATMRMTKYAVDVVPDKIIFGTDFPFNIDQTQKSVLNSLLELNIERDRLEKVLWRNASKLLKLDL